MFRYLSFTFNIPSIVAFYSNIMEVLKLASAFVLFYIQFSKAISADFLIAESITSILNEHKSNSINWTKTELDVGT